ncbi:MAG TPA: hypothetical protein VFU69_19850 [Ktedonobacterales bacterium]|nr:hypothetical protein [Ktedonobacterales bacterium]
MRRHHWIGLSLVLGLLLVAGLSVWPQVTLSAYAKGPKPKPTPTAPPTPTPTPTPTTRSGIGF